MARCDYCNSLLLFGGNKVGDLRFCNAYCQANGILKPIADQLPLALVQEHLEKLHSGSCPQCAGPGPVDVHTWHRVVSVLVATSWKSNPEICCQRCGTKKKAMNAIISAAFGWWGFPWGLIITPVQVARNTWGIFSGPDPSRPSDALERIVRLHLAATLQAAGDTFAKTAEPSPAAHADLANPYRPVS